jgi:hypothetical protein
MNNKYLKYKKKYSMLKGGILDQEELLDPELIDNDDDEIMKLFFTMQRKLAKTWWARDRFIGFNIIKSVPFNVIENKSDRLIWSKNIKKVNLRDIRPEVCNWNKSTTEYLTVWCRYYFKYYQLFTNKDILDEIQDNSYVITPSYNNICPYKYEFTLTILGAKFNMYDSVYNKYMQSKIITPLINNWVKKIYKEVRDRDPNTKDLNIYVLSGDSQIILVLTEPVRFGIEMRRELKIHIQIKLEYLFWVIQKIIENLSLFTYIDEQGIKFDSFNRFKFRVGFWRFSLPEFTANYPFRRIKKYKKDGIEYYTETQYEANIVFYTEYDYYGEDLQKKCIQHLINTLIKLFPDNLNINSDLFPRFNLRVTKNIFIGIGDGDYKQEDIKVFDNFDDFKKMNCDRFPNQLSCDKCSNKISKNITDHELCKWNTSTEKCESSKYYSFNLLTYKDKFRTIQEIEDYIGRPLYKEK